MAQELDQQTLQRLLAYDPETGIFTWREVSPRCYIVKAGDRAGGQDGHGYVRIRVLGTLHHAQRLAWLYMTGAWPSDEIDHRNTNRSDNRWDNLRPATSALNSQNRRTARRGSAAGVIGVNPRRGGFQARIMVNGKSKFLGDHDTAEAAHAAYVEAKRELHPGGTL